MPLNLEYQSILINQLSLKGKEKGVISFIIKNIVTGVEKYKILRIGLKTPNTEYTK